MKEGLSQMKIQITDNKELMEKIGEQLVQEHSSIYTEAMLATLRKTINAILGYRF